MAYIGNDPSNRFVAPKAASVFSGDGSTTAFTLDHAVGSDEDILVSVDGVIQEPSVAYAVSNGTTLTFTAAPSNNSGNNIFVYYLFRTVGTVSHPSNNALSATSGTFTGDLTVDTNTLIVDSTNNSVGIGASPDSNRDLHIKRTGANASILIEETSAVNYAQFIELKDSSTSWFLANRYATSNSGNTGFGIGTTNSGDMLQIDTSGHVTMPNQSAFMVRSNQTQSNFTTGSFVTVDFHSERFDQNSDFDNTNMVFTAPVTGRYQFNILITPLEMDSAANYFQVIFDASNVVLQAGLVDNDTVLNSDSAYFMFSGSSLIDMDAGDTCKIKVYQSGGTAQSDLGDGSATFSGYLVC
jgi:hypothetical protein